MQVDILQSIKNYFDVVYLRGILVHPGASGEEGFLLFFRFVLSFGLGFDSGTFGSRAENC